jgi:hypothetical protein
MRQPTSLTRRGYGRRPVVSQFLEVSAARKLVVPAYAEAAEVFQADQVRWR